MTSVSEPNPDQASIGELLVRLSEQSSRLVRAEVALAKVELQNEVKHAGIGAGLFGGAGLLSALGLLSLVAAAIGALALTLAVWLAALIVAGALFVLAGLAALLGRSQMRAVGPPDHTLASVRQDVETIKEARA